MSVHEQDPYATLGVSVTAPPEVIRAAYRALARLHHPDAGGDPARFAVIAQAFETVSDPAARAAWEAGTPRQPDGDHPPATTRPAPARNGALGPVRQTWIWGLRLAAIVSAGSLAAWRYHADPSPMWWFLVALLLALPLSRYLGALPVVFYAGIVALMTWLWVTTIEYTPANLALLAWWLMSFVALPIAAAVARGRNP